MTETVSSRGATSLRRGRDGRRQRAPLPLWRYVLGVAIGLVLAASVLTACDTGENTTEEDTVVIKKHLYLLGSDGTKFEISVGKDASGKDALTVTRAK